MPVRVSCVGTGRHERVSWSEIVQIETDCNNDGEGSGREMQGLRLSGFYFDSCVYDLMTTGDASFTGASYSSYLDLLKFIPDAVKNRNLTSKKLDATASSSGNSSCLRISGVLVLIAPISLLHALS